MVSPAAAGSSRAGGRKRATRVVGSDSGKRYRIPRRGTVNVCADHERGRLQRGVGFMRSALAGSETLCSRREDRVGKQCERRKVRAVAGVSLECSSQANRHPLGLTARTASFAAAESPHGRLALGFAEGSSRHVFLDGSCRRSQQHLLEWWKYDRKFE